MRRPKTLCLLGWVLIPGCWALTGPEKVMCYEGESFSVQCHYEESFTENTKFWCKDSILSLCSSLSIKSSSEDLVEKDRVSIRDNRKECYFEITMVKLNREDAGTYQCGIERGLLNDRHYIKVTVSADPKQTSATEELASAVPPASGGSKEQELYILIYCIIPLFLLLVVAAVVLFTISRKKKKGLGWTRKKVGKFEGPVFVQNLADSSCEQSIPHHPSSNGTGLSNNVEVHPENNYEELPPQEQLAQIGVMGRPGLLGSGEEASSAEEAEEQEKHPDPASIWANTKRAEEAVIHTEKVPPGDPTATPQHPEEVQRVSPPSSPEPVVRWRQRSPGNKDEVSYATVTISDPQHRFIYANVGFVPSPVLSKSQEVFYTEVAKRSTE